MDFSLGSEVLQVKVFKLYLFGVIQIRFQILRRNTKKTPNGSEEQFGMRKGTNQCWFGTKGLTNMFEFDIITNRKITEYSRFIVLCVNLLDTWGYFIFSYSFQIAKTKFRRKNELQIYRPMGTIYLNQEGGMTDKDRSVALWQQHARQSPKPI